MYWVSRPALVMLAMTVLAGSEQQDNHTASFAPVSNVTFRVSSGRTAFRSGETVRLAFEIRNVGTGPIRVPKGFESTACLDMAPYPFVWPWIEVAPGRRSSPGYGASCGGPQRLTMVQKLELGSVLLRPAETTKGELKIVPPPETAGRVMVGATLRGWRAGDLDAQREEWRSTGVPLLTGEVIASVGVMLVP